MTCSFLGRVPDADLPVLYAAGDLCVVPTRELEGFGYVVLEAYARGRPSLRRPSVDCWTWSGDSTPAAGRAGPAAIAERDPGHLASDGCRTAACRAYAARFAWERVVSDVEAGVSWCRRPR